MRRQPSILVVGVRTAMKAAWRVVRAGDAGRRGDEGNEQHFIKDKMEAPDDTTQQKEAAREIAHKRGIDLLSLLFWHLRKA